MRRHLALTALIASLLVSAQVHADAPTDSEPPPPTYWYGWQTLLSDGLSIGVVAIGIGERSTGVALLGTAAFIAAPAIIHGAHGNWLGTGVSVALRAGGTTLLLAGLATAFAESDWNTDAENPPTDDGPGATIMTTLGLVALFAAPLVDAVIAREPVRSTQARAWTLHPWIATQARGGGLSLSGRL